MTHSVEITPLPCPVCLGWPETPQTVNVGRTGYEPVLVTCSHPCHEPSGGCDEQNFYH